LENLVNLVLLGIGFILIALAEHINNKKKRDEVAKVRSNQKHKHIIHRKWFRVYYSGSYAWLEVDFGRINHRELSILFGCTDRLINWTYRKQVP